MALGCDRASGCSARDLRLRNHTLTRRTSRRIAWVARARAVETRTDVGRLMNLNLELGHIEPAEPANVIHQAGKVRPEMGDRLGVRPSFMRPGALWPAAENPCPCPPRRSRVGRAEDYGPGILRRDEPPFRARARHRARGRRPCRSGRRADSERHVRRDSAERRGRGRRGRRSRRGSRWRWIVGGCGIPGCGVQRGCRRVGPRLALWLRFAQSVDPADSVASAITRTGAPRWPARVAGARRPPSDRRHDRRPGAGSAAIGLHRCVGRLAGPGRRGHPALHAGLPGGRAGQRGDRFAARGITSSPGPPNGAPPMPTPAVRRRPSRPSPRRAAGSSSTTSTSSVTAPRTSGASRPDSRPTTSIPTASASTSWPPQWVRPRRRPPRAGRSLPTPLSPSAQPAGTSR